MPGTSYLLLVRLPNRLSCLAVECGWKFTTGLRNDSLILFWSLIVDVFISLSVEIDIFVIRCTRLYLPESAYTWRVLFSLSVAGAGAARRSRQGERDPRLSWAVWSPENWFRALLLSSDPAPAANGSNWLPLNMQGSWNNRREQ